MCRSVSGCLSLPHRLRYLLAWDHALCRAVSGVAMRTVLGFLRRRARRDGVADGRSGAVAIVQRFGGALNLNVHLHALVLDGVFTNDGTACGFIAVARLTREDVAEVVAVVARRVARLLERRGLAGDAESGEAPDVWSAEAPVLAAAAAASVEGRVALGPRAGARVRRCGDPPEDVTPTTLGPCHAHAGGFDLHAGLMVRAGHRDRLERLCRYALRPPLAQERLHRTGDGEIWLDAAASLGGRHDPPALRSAGAAGAAGRVDATAAGQPDSVLRCLGAARRRGAARMVPATADGVDVVGSREAAPGRGRELRKASRAGAYQWAELMRRTFGVDVLACPRCGGRLRLVALIDQASVIQRILRHFGLPTDVPEPRPARAPPCAVDPIEDQSQDAPEFDAAW